MSGAVWCDESVTVPWILADYATTRKTSTKRPELASGNTEGEGGSAED